MVYFKHFNLELNGTFLPPLAPNHTYFLALFGSQAWSGTLFRSSWPLGPAKEITLGVKILSLLRMDTLISKHLTRLSENSDFFSFSKISLQ